MDHLLTPEEVAERLRLDPEVLERWRAEQAGPRFLRLSRKVIRYAPHDVDAWLAARASADAAYPEHAA